MAILTFTATTNLRAQEQTTQEAKPSDPQKEKEDLEKAELWLSLAYADWGRAIEILKAKPALLSSIGGEKENPVHNVLRRAPPAKALLFLEAFPDQVSVPNFNGYAAIHLAIFNKNEAVVLKVLELDPQAPSRVDNDGNYPLHNCATGYYDNSCTPRVIEALYRGAPEALQARTVSRDTPVQRAYESYGDSTPFLLQMLKLDARGTYMAYPEMQEIAPLMEPTLAKLDPSSLRRDFISQRLDAFERQVSSAGAAPSGDFKWDLFLGALNTIATREPKSPLFDLWDERSLIQGIELFTHTVADRKALVKSMLAELYYEYDEEEPDPQSVAAVNAAVDAMFINYSEFLAKMIAEHIDAEALKRGEATALNLVYQFRSNIKKRAPDDDSRLSMFNVLVGYLAAQPELNEAVVSLDYLYHEGNFEEIGRRVRPYLEKIHTSPK
ncbi:MAG TPA: hypothetical protein VM901_08105 [Bdellovibrionota bacterium]|nr:hypothetical protein [Bdellovibrionota bacterium]